MNTRTVKIVLMVLAGISAVLAALSMIIGDANTMINASVIFLAVAVIASLITSLRSDAEQVEER